MKLTYDDHSRITSWTDRNGYWYRFTYDDQDRCVAGEGTDGLLPDVQAAYDRVPDHIREQVGGAHSKCGEAEALSHAMRAGVDPRGGVMAAVEVRAPGNPVHGQPKPACPSCRHVLEELGVRTVL
nr:MULTISPECIES: YwqJ-related putative deaminase [Streptomyces]